MLGVTGVELLGWRVSGFLGHKCGSDVFIVIRSRKNYP